MRHHAAPWDLSSTISGSEKLAAANSRRDVVADRSRPISAAAVGRDLSPEKLAAANFRSDCTSQHGPIPAEFVHTAWRRAA